MIVTWDDFDDAACGCVCCWMGVSGVEDSINATLATMQHEWDTTLGYIYEGWFDDDYPA